MTELLRSVALQIFVTTAYLIPGVYLLSAVRRKWLADQQSRVGPKLVGFYGLLQPIADFLVKISRTAFVSRSASESGGWFWLSMFGIYFIVFTLPIGTHLPHFDSELSVLVSFIGLVILLGGLAGSLRENESVDSVLKLIEIVPYVVSSAIAVMLGFASTALVYDSYQWKSILDAQADGVWSWGVVHHPVLILPLASFFCSGFVILKQVRGYPAAMVGISSAKGVVAEFSIRVFELAWFSWIALLFFGGSHLPLQIDEMFSENPTFQVLIEISSLLTKALLVQFVFEFIDSLVPKLDGDQLLGFTWRFLIPLGLIGLSVSILYRGLGRAIG